MIKLPCSLFLQTLTPVTLSLPCPISSSNAAAAAAFPGSDIRAFIGPFTIGYLYWLLKYCQRFELEVFTEDPRPDPKKKNSVARDLSRKKQSAGGVNTSGRSVIMDSFMSDVKKKLRQNEYKEVKSSG